MLINFEVLMSRYGIPRGVIHIGAHDLQERGSYKKYNLHNTVWVEANPRIVERVKTNVLLDEKEQIYNFAITDKDGEIELNITSFDQSSSILKLGTHKNYYPQIDVTETIKVSGKRMDTLIEEFHIKVEEYNFLNLDIQGAELQALKGFGKYLKDIDFIYTEVNKEPLYEGCCLLPELDSFLSENGFKQVELSMTTANWGDAFYIKQ